MENQKRQNLQTPKNIELLRCGVSVHEQEVGMERPDASRVTVSVHIEPSRDGKPCRAHGPRNIAVTGLKAYRFSTELNSTLPDLVTPGACAHCSVFILIGFGRMIRHK
jgi:hypothetical protein